MIDLFALLPFLLQGAPVTPSHSPYKACGTVFYMSYDPPQLRSMSRLPGAVSAAVRTGLVRRLGPSLYNRLRFDGGQVIDPARVRRSESRVREPIPSYILIFTVQGHFEQGFWICTTLDATGNALEEVPFPDIAAHPERANVIERDAAILIAKQNGVPVERAEVRLEYFRDADVLEWQVSYNLEYRPQQGGRRRVCHIPAHDPAAVHWSEYEFVH